MGSSVNFPSTGGGIWKNPINTVWQILPPKCDKPNTTPSPNSPEMGGINPQKLMVYYWVDQFTVPHQPDLADRENKICRSHLSHTQPKFAETSSHGKLRCVNTEFWRGTQSHFSWTISLPNYCLQLTKCHHLEPAISVTHQALCLYNIPCCSYTVLIIRMFLVRKNLILKTLRARRSSRHHTQCPCSKGHRGRKVKTFFTMPSLISP